MVYVPIFVPILLGHLRRVDSWYTLFMSRYTPGDPVIYRMPKLSARPGQRARDIRPQTQGEFYTYVVEKFWRIADIQDDGKLRLVTRRGKEHVVAADDPHLRKPRWWERMIYGSRFPTVPR